MFHLLFLLQSYMCLFAIRGADETRARSAMVFMNTGLKEENRQTLTETVIQIKLMAMIQLLYQCPLGQWCLWDMMQPLE